MLARAALMSPETEAAITRAFREERGRILATLIRLLGDFDTAEEALAEAFAAALRAVAARRAVPATRGPG